jgi:hypothetical protein
MSPVPVIVPSYPKAGLPPAGTVGSLARLADDVHGLWMDTGTQWFGVSGQIINVKEFGATGDGISNDTDAINRALAAASAQGNPVYLPTGTYKCLGSVTIPFSGCTIFGASSRATIVKFLGTGNGYIVPNDTGGWMLRDLQIYVGASAGPAIFFSPPPPPPGGKPWLAGGGYDFIEDVVITMDNPAASAIQGGKPAKNGGVGIEAVFFRGLYITAAGGFTTPLVALYGAYFDGLNNITFEECWIEGNSEGRAPLFAIEAVPTTGPPDPATGPPDPASTVVIGYAADINFEKCVFEVPIAGAIRFRSVSRVRVSACWAGDLPESGPINPIFDINLASGDGLSGLPSQDYLFDSVQIDAGQHGAATIYCLGTSGNGGVVLLNSFILWLDNGSGGTGLNPFGNPFLNIGSQIIGWDGDPPLGTTDQFGTGFRLRTIALQTWAAQGLGSGANENVILGPSPTGSASKIRIAAGNGATTGPNAPFSIGGFGNKNPTIQEQENRDGQLLYVYNESGFQMTLKNESAGSPDPNRILTLTGADVVLRSGKSYAVLQYDGYDNRWILVSTN